MFNRISRRIVIPVFAIVMVLSSVTLYAEETCEEAAASQSTKIIIDEIDYDPGDREVEIEFRHKVIWKKAKVRIYDSNGKNYTRYIKELDDDEVSVKVKKLKYGRKYKFKISGVKRRYAKKFRIRQGSFRAIDR